jgi:hypothetical protein
MQRTLTPILLALTLLITGCTTLRYTTPGPAADMKAFGVTPADEREQLTDYKIQQELDRKPLATFPANICIARVQGSGYRSYGNQSFGAGAYSVVLTRDVETDEQLQKIAELPMIAGLAPVNRMLLTSNLKSDMELRQAAAKLHAQILLIYTLDTHFYNQNNASPADVITFGFGKHQKVRITSTASAALLDVRNGYVYGVAEASAQHEQPTTSWNNKKKADESRLAAESEAFDKLVTELTRTWKDVVHTYAKPATISAAQ